MSAVSLYKIAEAYRADLAKLADLDLPADVIADTLEGMSGALEEKVEARCFVIRNMDASIAGVEAAIKEMQGRLKSMQGRRDQLAQSTLDAMVACGKSRIESPYLRISVGENPEKVDIFEQALIPAFYMRTPEPVPPEPVPPEPAPDKVAIKAALQAGQDVPGCRLVRGKKLAIK